MWLVVVVRARWCVVSSRRGDRSQACALAREREWDLGGGRERERKGRTERRAIETRFLPPGVRSLVCIPR